jgi:serine protease inhibitor
MEVRMKPLFFLLVQCTVLLTPALALATSPSSDDRAALVEGNNAFAVALYGQLRSQSGNLFLSPESISTALAMAYAGTRGQTASEMAKTMHFTLPPERLHPAMGALLNDLNATHPGYQLRVADALWAQQDYKFLDSFLTLTKDDYGAGFHPVDFKLGADATRQMINQWVAEKTENKIKDLLAPGVLSARTRLVLTNAIYFKGNWETQFDKAQTKEEDFHLSSAQNVTAPLMHREGRFNYFNGGTFQVLEIPYKSQELSMIVLLPNDVGGLAALEESLTADNARDWLHKLGPVSKVIVTMPRFTMTKQFGLRDTLGAMGMVQAFQDGRANFSGMSDDPRGLVISAVIHKAFIDVNEEGTEAAAATAVTVRSAAARMPDRMPPIVFRADHPFLFLIRDNRSGGFLFMGRVADPTK